MKQETKDRIFEYAREKTLATFERVGDRPGSGNPFTKAILPDVNPRTLAFERSFSTSLGQSTIERMAEWVAQDNGAETERQRVTRGKVAANQLAKIDEIKRQLRDGKNNRSPNWEREVKEVADASSGSETIIQVTSDLYVRNPDGTEQFFSIKSPKPNLDQGEHAKEDCLKLKAIDPAHETYFGLHHNPYGEENRYKWGLTFRIFEFGSPALLVGEAFWDFIGGPGTYESLIGIFEGVNDDLQDEIDVFFSN